MDQQRFFSTSQVARIAGVKMHQLAYALANGAIPDASARFLDKRLFTEQEVANIAAYFDGLRETRKENQDEA